MPTEATAAAAAADAAQEVVFSRLDADDVNDFDLTVQFEDGRLEVDITLETAAPPAKEQAVADDAVRAAGAAVDHLFSEEACS